MKESLHPAGKTKSTLWLSTGGTAKKILLVVALLLIIFLVWVVFGYGINAFDQKIFDCITPYIADSLTRFMLFITVGGNTYFLIAANVSLLLYFIYKKEKWWAIRVAAISVSSLGVMSLLKRLFHRLRPSDPMIDGVTNFSFPSGHAFMSVAFYGLLIIYAAFHFPRKWLRQILIYLLLFVIIAIGFSRIYLRMHFATDIIAGFSIGTCWLFFCLWLVNKIKQTSGFVAKQ